MKSWIAASLTLLAMTPLAAYADVIVTSQNLLKGSHMVTACVPEAANTAYCICDVEINYPQIQGLENKALETSINTLLKSKVEATECGGKELKDVEPSTQHTQHKNNFKETYRDANLLAVIYEFYSYYPGAAHGLPGIEGVIVDLTTGKALGANELFDAKDFAAINAEILQQLKAMPEGDVFEDTLNAPDVAFVSEAGCEACTFVLSKDKGLQAKFPPYGVGPYSSGVIEVNIPKNFIKDSRVKNVVGK